MTRKNIGLLMLTLAIVLLSIQFYCLPILQYLSFAHTGQAYAEVLPLLSSFPLNISFLLSFSLLIMGCVLTFRKKEF